MIGGAIGAIVDLWKLTTRGKWRSYAGQVGR
jgi:hypothetical protein